MLNAIYFEELQYQETSLKRLEREFVLNIQESPHFVETCDLDLVNVVFAPLGYQWDGEFFDKCPNLKVIASNTTGCPHIDLFAAQQRGVDVVTLKDEQAFLEKITPTAEHTIGLILALTRQLLPAVHSVEKGEWHRRPFGGPAMLSRSSLGIIGFGRLGKMVAGYGIALGMKVSFYDPLIDWEKIEPKWGDNIVRHLNLRDLVRDVDIVSLHVPHSPLTENIIDRGVFQEFKVGSYFINTARGELVDHKALLQALESKRLAGAALDVFENEFDPEFSIVTHELWKYFRANHNLILTPHIGGSTKDAWRMTEELTIDRVVQRLRARENEVSR